MSSLTDLNLIVGARNSKLSRAQVQEVFLELGLFYSHIQFSPLWIETSGDLDLITSLRQLEKTDFFTREIDLLQRSGGCRITIHSAKDLKEPLPEGLTLVALTRGVDPSDSLVFPYGKDLSTLSLGSRVGTSSLRREKNIHSLRSDLVCVDIRGTIDSRLMQLDRGDFDALIVAEAALIRLGLTDRPRMKLPGPSAALQGQLAIVARDGDEEMRLLFAPLDCRGNG